jgi:hypothetical protein
MSVAHVSAIRLPMSVLPVKLTMSTSGAATSASAHSGVEPTTRLTTPGGKPEHGRARLGLHQPEQLLGAILQKVGSFVQQRRPFLGRSARPGAEGLGSGCDRPVSVPRRGFGRQTDGLLGRRIDDLVGTVLATDRPAADPALPVHAHHSSSQ